MGPKKEAPKKENVVKLPSIDDPLNSEAWRCVVVMAVERSHLDSFVLKEFTDEASTERRKEVKLINLDTSITKILNDFANGELAFKYAFLLNFSEIFQEAAEFTKTKSDIPIPVLVKVIKALLLFLKEESLIKIEKKALGPPDPIKAMADRPANLGGVEMKGKVNKKEAAPPPKGKKTEGELQVRPPSVSKQDTKLLKRGEGVKEDECIDDAPADGYFNLYVLLTGFYSPELPLELIKAGIPLHGLLCIDTSLAQVNRVSSSTTNVKTKISSQIKTEDIQKFWEGFLTILWDPKTNFYFKDTIFQVYVPQKLTCEKQMLKEFIYREISYLLYDMSDYKRQLLDYLKHLKLRGVDGDAGATQDVLGLISMPNECVTPPVVLQFIMDAICTDDEKFLEESFSLASSDSKGGESGEPDKYQSESLLTKYGSTVVMPAWSQLIEESGDLNLLSLYSKVKELDVKYNLDERMSYDDVSEEASFGNESILGSCRLVKLNCGENMEVALNSEGSALKSCWRMLKISKETTRFPVAIDYCLYPVLMAKVPCQYQEVQLSLKSFTSSKRSSCFHLIQNISEEMRKPHFTVTDGSRSVLRSVPFNVKDSARDFFSPAAFKIVTPQKLKASSAPEFRLPPHLTIETSFISDFYPADVPMNENVKVFENLRNFLGEDVFTCSTDFDFIEELSKQKLLQKEYDMWDRYNCADYSYSFLTDSIFVVLHNRKDSDDFHHETFNQVLKTSVGLRDFFEYILEDESEWFDAQNELYKNDLIFFGTKSSQGDTFRNFSETDFWLINSIKYQERLKRGSKSDSNGKKEDRAVTTFDKLQDGENKTPSKEILQDVVPDGPYDFEGYDVSDMAVQYSGLKTSYYEDDCSITVELTERLYGNQDLGLHISQGSHTLHLYSFVCPQPHVIDPYTCHLVFKNGIIVAFSRRFIETFEEEATKAGESKTSASIGKTLSEVSTPSAKKSKSKLLQDNEFLYDMRMSYPNGLTIKTVRRIVKPCYIKQEYLIPTDTKERSRLFLPNGSLVKMMTDGTVEILKIDTSVVTASLNDLISDSEELNFEKYEVTMGDGYACVFEHGATVSSRRFQVFQNTDVETNQVFFRRRDGTNYLLQNDGSLCVEFRDGSRICSSPFINEEPTSWNMNAEEDFETSEDTEVFGEFDSDSDFVVVHLEVVFEHHAYATAIYNTDTKRWKILLPFEATILVEPEGNYSVSIDKQTEFKIEDKVMQMNRFSLEGELLCSATTDLTVFENDGGGIYCQMEQSNGKSFVVEANAHCYVFKDEEMSGDLISLHSGRRSQLTREKKYLMVRRDITGLEVLHTEDVTKALTEVQTGSVVFTQEIPGSENRIFTLVTPAPKKRTQKWEVESILPNPTFQPNTVRMVSSTYGQPPSWMHPFPKRKAKFSMPENLTCRVFMETKKTELSPVMGAIDCCFCEVEEVPEIKHTQIENVKEYIKKLADDDQDILGEMYAILAGELINAKKKQKPVNSEKLEHYLEMSRYYVEMQEYHKKCIRYHIVPNYFHHPAGMSWLILNDLLMKLKLPEQKSPRQFSMKTPVAPTSKASSTFSNEEIEYNLALSARQSFSDLSCRTDISAATAPSFLETRGICRCKVRAVRDVTSAPIYHARDEEQSHSEDDSSPASQQNICNFQDDEIEMLEKTSYNLEESSPLTLEDLMCLGLV